MDLSLRSRTDVTRAAYVGDAHREKPMFDSSDRELKILSLGGGLLLVLMMWAAVVAAVSA